jgi:hypothetical protein
VLWNFHVVKLWSEYWIGRDLNLVWTYVKFGAHAKRNDVCKRILVNWRTEWTRFSSSQLEINQLLTFFVLSSGIWTSRTFLIMTGSRDSYQPVNCCVCHGDNINDIIAWFRWLTYSAVSAAVTPCDRASYQASFTKSYQLSIPCSVDHIKVIANKLQGTTHTAFQSKKPVGNSQGKGKIT